MIGKVLVAGLVLAGVVTSAIAQNDPIAQRKAIMKGVGDLWYGDVNKMMKGELPYNHATVVTALERMQAAGKSVVSLFPDNSKTGGETKALPEIWTQKADFDARWPRMVAEATAALASVKDEASFKAAQPNLNKNCQECHSTYRQRNN
jgi:cytochrome c556